MTQTTNKFQMMPENGTVLAVLTEEEYTKFEKINLLYEALKTNPNVFKKQETIDILKAHQDFWISICKKYDINNAWSLGLDLVTGEIYIDEK